MKTAAITLTVLLGAAAVGAGACAAAPPTPAATPAATAATTSATTPAAVRAVILVQKAQPLRTALDTGRAMRAGEALPADAFTVVVCGEAVTALRAGGDLDGALAAAAEAGVRVVACGISLERSGIAPSALAPSVTVVDNGLVEVLRLQREGYLSVEL